MVNRTYSDGTLSACAQIRDVFRMDAGGKKGKQCPGGYWIAKDKQCGKGGKGGGKMRSPGGGGRAAAAAGGAALATGVAAAYANRDKIVAGVDRLGEKARQHEANRVERKSLDMNVSAKELDRAKSRQELVGRAASAASKGARQLKGAGEKVAEISDRNATRALGGVKATARAVKNTASGTIGMAKQALGKQRRKQEAPSA